MADDIPQWAISRRKDLVEDVFQASVRNGFGCLTLSECTERAFARYIAAHEEPPVDPLLIEAREICAATWTKSDGNGIRAGNYDKCEAMLSVLAAIKRGIEIAGERK